MPVIHSRTETVLAVCDNAYLFMSLIFRWLLPTAMFGRKDKKGDRKRGREREARSKEGGGAGGGAGGLAAMFGLDMGSIPGG